MLSSNNILSPASGRPLAMPRLDMVTGLYFLTTEIDGDIGEYVPAAKDQPESGVYSSPAEAIMALDRGALSVRAKIKVRLTQLRPPAEVEAELFPTMAGSWATPGSAETTLGRVLFNELLPQGLPVRQQADAQEGAGVDHQRSRRALPDDRGRADRRQAQGRRLPLGHPFGCHRVDGRRAGAAAEAGDPRSATRQEADAIEKKYQRGALEPRRAQRGSGQDLAGRHRRGR